MSQTVYKVGDCLIYRQTGHLYVITEEYIYSEDKSGFTVKKLHHLGTVGPDEYYDYDYVITELFANAPEMAQILYGKRVDSSKG